MNSLRHQPRTGEANQLLDPHAIAEGMIIEVASFRRSKPVAIRIVRTIGALFAGQEAGETGEEAARRAWLATGASVTPVWRGIVASLDEVSANVIPIPPELADDEGEFVDDDEAQAKPGWKTVHMLYQDLGLTAFSFVDPEEQAAPSTPRDIGRWAPVITSVIAKAV